MNILLLGANGQLGWELTRTCPEHITLVTCDDPKVDFTSPESIHTCIKRSSPEWIINAAAYTAVDLAETDKKKARRINCDAVAQIAGLAQKNNSGLIHISTDYVFSGRGYLPWQPEDEPDPESVYGLTKAEGEKTILNEIKDRFLIIRTAWLYSSHGNNFVKTMLKLMNSQKSLNVIDEQIGTPTWANGLARAIWTCLEKKIYGVHHWTDAGVASWYDFAMAIQEEGLCLDLIKAPVKINPVSSDCFPAAAPRPFYSVLDKRTIWQASEIDPVHWREQLRAMLKEMKH